MNRDFGNVADKEKQVSLNRLIDAIIAQRPDLAEMPFAATGMGKCSLTVKTMDEVFKAPLKGRSNVDMISDEAKFLAHLNGKDLGVVQIPTVTTVAEDGSFYGMTRVHGVPLTPEVLSSLPEDEQQRIAHALADFNVRMSKSFDANDHAALDLSYDFQPWHLKPSNVQDSLKNPMVRAVLGAHYDSCVRAANEFSNSYDPKIGAGKAMTLFGDMHPENIFYDRETGAISVIDIGNGCTYDMEICFATLKHTYPQGFVDHFLQSFSAMTGRDVSRESIERFRGLYSMACLQGALQRSHGEDIKFHKERIVEFIETQGVTKRDAKRSGPAGIRP